MQDQFPPGSVPVSGAVESDNVELTPLDEVAIAATSPLATDHYPEPAVPGRGHKMEILDDTIAALDKATGQESQLVQMVKGWIDKAAAMAHVAVDKTASTVVPLAEAAASAKVSTAAKAQDYKESALVAKDQWVDDTRTAIQNRPLTALGIATLAGVAISLIFFSSSDSDAPDA